MICEGCREAYLVAIVLDLRVMSSVMAQMPWTRCLATGSYAFLELCRGLSGGYKGRG
jgi:hypothetical protein